MRQVWAPYGLFIFRGETDGSIRACTPTAGLARAPFPGCRCCCRKLPINLIALLWLEVWAAVPAYNSLPYADSILGTGPNNHSQIGSSHGPCHPPAHMSALPRLQVNNPPCECCGSSATRPQATAGPTPEEAEHGAGRTGGRALWWGVQWAGRVWQGVQRGQSVVLSV